MDLDSAVSTIAKWKTKTIENLSKVKNINGAAKRWYKRNDGNPDLGPFILFNLKFALFAGVTLGASYVIIFGTSLSSEYKGSQLTFYARAFIISTGIFLLITTALAIVAILIGLVTFQYCEYRYGDKEIF